MGRLKPQAIASPTLSTGILPIDFVSPQTETEKGPCSDLAGLLKIEQYLQINDDFFLDLGGTRLLAIRLS